MIFLGIDPGKTGGISRHNGSDVSACKFTDCTPADMYKLIHEFSRGQCVALIEKVHSMPKQGVKSSFTFGKNYGMLLMALTALEIPFEYVSPAVWQRYLKCKTGGDKKITRQKAQELFPHLKITHAIADALLIGEYYKRTYEGESCTELEDALESILTT